MQVEGYDEQLTIPAAVGALVGLLAVVWFRSKPWVERQVKALEAKRTDSALGAQAALLERRLTAFATQYTERVARRAARDYVKQLIG